MNNDLSKDSETVIRALVSTGLSRNSAKVLVYISMNEGATSENIERDMTLRQPDVSVAVQDLYTKGWLSRISVKKVGKGRPKYIYNLSKPFRDIVDEIETSEMKRIKDIEMNISSLKSSELFSKL